MLNCQGQGNRKKQRRRRKHRKAKSIKRSDSSSGNPLMIFMLDGMRWDYVSRLQNRMPGFSRFLSEGVQTEYVETIFPVVSYAAWTTLSTGVYPETHGIMGNYMVDLEEDPTGNDIFRLGDRSTTTKAKWWQNSEPIWITATRQKKRTFLRYWSRCDVPFNSLTPEECSGYSSAGGVQSINKTLSVGLEKLRDGFDLVMLYGEEIDNLGHKYGPDSYEMQTALLELDAVFMEFLEGLDKYPRLRKKLNIIIVSDHGMTDVRPSRGVTYLRLDDYIDKRDILRIVEDGSFMNIQPIKSSVNYVYEQLKQIPGVDVYKKADIPENLHYKNNRIVLDILLVSRVGYIVVGLQSAKQIPRPHPQQSYRIGVHGYTPALSDIRAIFYARGPAFKKNEVFPPINMVDIYQLYTHCLGIAPQPNNGTWTNVVGMLAPPTR
ncbi:unnamed protein product [Allacma fusca]|uniref:Ectonucleotide pyrophosphatase/phosphodiesterase family member 6 n=1 Tax=Allacma fusca TaxID=39272 RepID=A0A8J2KPQ3_9HEXA|nr:unnamed protein product [Allacma fusca]